MMSDCQAEALEAHYTLFFCLYFCFLQSQIYFRFVEFSN